MTLMKMVVLCDNLSVISKVIILLISKQHQVKASGAVHFPANNPAGWFYKLLKRIMPSLGNSPVLFVRINFGIVQGCL